MAAQKLEAVKAAVKDLAERTDPKIAAAAGAGTVPATVVVSPATAPAPPPRAPSAS